MHVSTMPTLRRNVRLSYALVATALIFVYGAVVSSLSVEAPSPRRVLQRIRQKTEEEPSLAVKGNLTFPKASLRNTEVSLIALIEGTNKCDTDFDTKGGVFVFMAVIMCFQPD